MKMTYDEYQSLITALENELERATAKEECSREKYWNYIKYRIPQEKAQNIWKKDFEHKMNIETLLKKATSHIEI